MISGNEKIMQSSFTSRRHASRTGHFYGTQPARWWCALRNLSMSLEADGRWIHSGKTLPGLAPRFSYLRPAEYLCRLEARQTSLLT